MKPTPLEDAVRMIRTTFPELALRDWATRPEDEACLQAHFVLGLWVRNMWVHGEGSPLARRIKAAAWFVHDDDISKMVIRALWRVLNGFPCPSVEELLLPFQLKKSNDPKF